MGARPGTHRGWVLNVCMYVHVHCIMFVRSGIGFCRLGVLRYVCMYVRGINTYSSVYVCIYVRHRIVCVFVVGLVLMPTICGTAGIFCDDASS